MYVGPAGVDRGTRPAGIVEVEIETTASRAAERRRSARFLKGPIPLASLAVAARLRGRALALLLLIHHRTAVTGEPMASVPARLLAEFGIGRDAKARGLRELEAAGLVRVRRERGRTARVGLAVPPTRGPTRG